MGAIAGLSDEQDFQLRCTQFMNDLAGRHEDAEEQMDRALSTGDRRAFGDAKLRFYHLGWALVILANGWQMSVH